MKKKKKLSLLELLGHINNEFVDITDFYLLLQLKEGVEPQFENYMLEDDWIISNETQSGHLLTQKSLDFISKIEALYNGETQSKISLEKVEEYRELFPDGKLPSGKRARVNSKELQKRFEWFFDTYKFDWDTILQATENYIQEYEKKSPKYMYMRTSEYFIKKQMDDKSWVSGLADYCDVIDKGESEIPADNNYFPVKTYDGPGSIE